MSLRARFPHRPWPSLLLGPILALACSSEPAAPPDADPVDGGAGDLGPVVEAATAETLGDEVAAAAPSNPATLVVTIADSTGRPVAGAGVAAGLASARSDAEGRVALTISTTMETAVTVAAPGFATQVKVVNLPTGAATGALAITLITREPAVSIAVIEGGGSARGREGVAVTFPPGALLDASGQPVRGSIEMHMTPVDVAGSSRDAFPGLYEGIAMTGLRRDIVSFGTAELVPMQGGQKLALAPGKVARIELPIYVREHEDGRSIQVGDEIPVWSLDEASGIWRQETIGEVVAAPAAPSGLAVSASVTHFSWWNGDAVSFRGRVRLRVRVPGETVPMPTTATVYGRVLGGAGPTSTASMNVLVDVPRVLAVASSGTTRLEATLVHGTSACAGQLDVVPPFESDVEIVIDTTCTPAPVPTIVSPAHGTATNSQSDLAFQVTLQGPVPDLVELYAGDVRIGQSGPDFFYRFFWNTSNVAEGLHVITARTTLAGATRASAPIEIVVDRTPPELVAITPAPGAVVSRQPSFVLEFNEPIWTGLAGLFGGSAVVMASTPTGAAGPTPVASHVQFDASRTEITVRPRVPLSLGAVSLGWGSLRDGAGNLVTGTVAALFAVSATIAAPDGGAGVDGGSGGGNPGLGACMFGVRPVPPVAEVRLAEPLPVAQGGRISSGYHRLIAREIFTGPGGAAGPTGRMYKVSIANVLGLNPTWREERAVDAGLPEKRMFRPAINGTRVVMTEACPGQSQRVLDLTVVGRTVKLIDPASGTVETYQAM